MEAAVPTAKKPKLLDRARSDLRVKRYSIRAEKAYIDWIRRFILFHGKRHPNEMGEQKISAFLTHLAVDRNVAASTQNQAFCALSRRWRYGTGPWPTVTMMVSTIFGFARHRSHPHTGGGRRQDHEGKIASSHHRRWTVCADSTLKDLTNR